jgi:Domain of unknown function (DUF5666)
MSIGSRDRAMKTARHTIAPEHIAVVLLTVIAFWADFSPRCYASPLIQQAQQSSAAGAASRHIGAIKSIDGTALTLTPASGPDVNITVQPTTRMVRVAPGEKDLKNATPIHLQDLQVGDRILVGGKLSDDNSTVMATTIVVMTQSAIAARQQQELQDWQKRGVDGPVTAVDAAAATVTISSRSKSILIQTSKTTVIRRYAPDSVKFDDAKASTLAEIHPGDQVRARGDRSADGTELTADEIVSGTFRNIAGTVNSVDASSSSVNVHDLLSNKNVTVKVSPDSQLHQLPPEIAQRIAARLKRLGARGAGAAPSDSSGSSGQPAHAQADAGANGSEGGMARRAPDLQQILSRSPTVSLNDLHKGDAVIILATEGSAGVGTTITLLTGVDPILQAAPNASGASILTPWSLSAPSSGDAGGP